MAKIFLDTNYFIDIIGRNPREEVIKSLLNHSLFISPLSFHIYCYIFKIKIPNESTLEQKDEFQVVEFSEDILNRSLQGPTTDFEDNVQLHSAADADCDVFLTEDKKLMGMKYFGKVKINSN